MCLPFALANAVKVSAEKAGIVYQRYIRQVLESSLDKSQ